MWCGAGVIAKRVESVEQRWWADGAAGVPVGPGVDGIDGAFEAPDVPVLVVEQRIRRLGGRTGVRDLLDKAVEASAGVTALVRHGLAAGFGVAHGGGRVLGSTVRLGAVPESDVGCGVVGLPHGGPELMP